MHHYHFIYLFIYLFWILGMCPRLLTYHFIYFMERVNSAKYDNHIYIILEVNRGIVCTPLSSENTTRHYSKDTRIFRWNSGARCRNFKLNKTRKHSYTYLYDIIRLKCSKKLSQFVKDNTNHFSVSVVYPPFSY
jgi:hypothetical protein